MQTFLLFSDYRTLFLLYSCAVFTKMFNFVEVTYLQNKLCIQKKKNLRHSVVCSM